VTPPLLSKKELLENAHLDLAKHTFQPTVISLKKKLNERVVPLQPQATNPNEDRRAQWLQFYSSLSTSPKEQTVRMKYPRVSVIITHQDRPEMLEQVFLSKEFRVNLSET